MWGRVRGTSGRGYGDYFSTIRSVQRQAGGERGLHGACSVGQYLWWMDGAWRATRAAADATVRRARRFFFRDAGVMWEGVV